MTDARSYQEAAEALAAGDADARAGQLAAEVAVAGTADAQVCQTVVEALVPATNEAHLFHDAVEVLLPNATEGWLYHEAAEVLVVAGPPEGRATQDATEVLVSNDLAAITYQDAAEVLVSNPAATPAVSLTVVTVRPPLGLSVNITDASGAVKQWHSHVPSAEDRPRNLQFGSRRMHGHATMSVDLARRIDRDYVDVHLLDNAEVVGADGTTAWDGRVGALPRSADTTHTLSLQCAGWMAHARDRKFTGVYVDRDLNNFTNPSSYQQLVNDGMTYPPGGSVTVRPDTSGTPALVQQFDRLANTAPGGPILTSRTWYDLGAGNAIGALYYDMVSVNVGVGWTIGAVLEDQDYHSGGETTGALGTAAAGYYIPSGSARRFISLMFYYTGTITADGLWQAQWRKLAVYGDHGLERHGDDPGGLYASDVIRHIINNYCPKLSTAGITDTSYPIPHLTFRDPIDPYDAFLEINKYHLWDLSVWDGRTVHYGPTDLTDYDWEVRLGDPGTSTTLQGDSTENLANGIAVTFTNVATGATERLIPSDYAELRDDAVENPANQHGLQVWTEYNLSAPATRDAALQIGRAALAEYNQPQAPGSITVGPYVRDRAGHWQPYWKIRANDRVAITSSMSLSDRPRVIQEVSHSQTPDGGGRAVMAVDSTFRTLPAVLDRIGTALTAANLA